MNSTPKKKAHKLINPIEEIERHANTRGVSILLDADESTSTSKIGSLYSFDKKDKILIINTVELSKKNKPFLLNLIRNVYDAGELTWKASRSEVLSLYQTYRKTNEYKEILDIFFKILPLQDYNALKMSFFVRDLSKRGMSIHTYKMDIKDRFGDRGANICNLCSAGYFETELKDIYDTDTLEEFQKYYSLVVDKKARALFVHSGMTREGLESEIMNMVEKAIKYHMGDFRIHGIGKSNIETIKAIISKLEAEDNVFEIKLVYMDTRSVEYMVSIVR